MHFRTGRSAPVGLVDVLAARELLTGVVSTTPVAGSRALSQLCAGPIWLKCENLQRTGSFKIRGAYTRIARLDAAQRAHGVVAASAGNHAQGVALAAQTLGIASTVFMPAQAALPKVAATRGYGADVHLVGETVDDAIAAANAFAERTGAVLVHPFDHPDIIAGQGTVGLELLEQVPDVRSVLVGTGGGGLLGGIAAAVKGLRPDVEVIGVQSAAAPAAYHAWKTHDLAAGEMATVAEGLATRVPFELPQRILWELLDTFVLVSEEEIRTATRLMIEGTRNLVEPAGAAPLAAAHRLRERLAGQRVALILSGGNITLDQLRRVLA